MPANEIQLVSIPVSDQDRAKRFYEGVLGFETLADRTVEAGTRWLQMRPPGCSVSVSLVTWFPSMPAGSLRGLVVGTDDLDGDVERINDHNIDLGPGVVVEPWGRFVTFADPDGNGLVLQQITG